MPTWLPSRLLDQAEQRDFLGGVQPYVADLQRQVQSGITGLTQTAKDMARSALPPAITGAPAPVPGLDSGGDRGYLDPARPPPLALPSLGGTPSPSATPVAPLPAPSASPPAPAPSAIQPFTLPSFESLTGASAAAAAPTSTPAGASAAGVPRNSTDRSPFTLPTWQDLTGFAEPVRPAEGPPAPTAPLPPSVAASSAARPSMRSDAGGPAAAGPPPPAAPAPAGPASERGGDLHAYARAAAARNGVDPDVFERQIQQESGFNPSAKSPVGASGIAQFMPDTAKAYGVNVADPYSSLDGAAKHMADNLRANNGDYRFALAAYNAGQGNVNRYGEGVFGADFAHGQTRDYVRIILGDSRPQPFGAAPAADARQSLHPRAAAAFEQANGRPPTPDEVAEMARLGLG